MNPPHAHGHLPSLTGMRWLAALLVFGLHVNNVEYFRPGHGATAIGWLFGAGATGVSFFFILSGFVLAWSARDADSPWGFWRRRLARIYPVHLVTVLCALLLAWTLIPTTRPDFGPLLANLFLVHAWPADGPYSQGLNPVSWTLACEAFFYACFPLILWALRGLDARGLRIVAWASLVSVLTVPFVGGYYLHFFPPARLGEFLLGVTIALLVRAGAWRGPGLWGSLGIVAAGYALVGWAPGSWRFAACTVVGFALLIAAGARADMRGTRSWWRNPKLVRLGEWSFAFYMIHILVMRTGEFVFASHPKLAPLPGIGATAASFAVSLALSWALYEWVESPARRLILRSGRTAVVPRPRAPEETPAKVAR